MSKKINSALKDLKRALEAHADVVGGSAVSLKKAQRASAKVAAAAGAYAEAVHVKSGLSTPFSDLLTPGLEESTLASLTAERDSLKQHLTGPVPIQEPASTDQHEPESDESSIHSDSDGASDENDESEPDETEANEEQRTSASSDPDELKP
ncbi:MAG: hypothetical protein LH471_00870 [Salinibacterium sp.]|nr:hypothetical protein [Salinibacterium sp.]